MRSGGDRGDRRSPGTTPILFRALMPAGTPVFSTRTKPLRGGKITVTRRACVGLALHLLRVTSRLPKPPLLPARPIYVLKQTACRPAASFKKPVPERPRRLAVKPSSAPALRVQASSFSTARPSRSGEKLVLYKLVRAGSGDPARTSAIKPRGKKTCVNRNFAACQCWPGAAPCTPCFQSFPGDVGYAKIPAVIRVQTGFHLQRSVHSHCGSLARARGRHFTYGHALNQHDQPEPDSPAGRGLATDHVLHDAGPFWQPARGVQSHREAAGRTCGPAGIGPDLRPHAGRTRSARRAAVRRPGALGSGGIGLVGRAGQDPPRRSRAAAARPFRWRRAADRGDSARRSRRLVRHGPPDPGRGPGAGLRPLQPGRPAEGTAMSFGM